MSDLQITGLQYKRVILNLLLKSESDSVNEDTRFFLFDPHQKKTVDIDPADVKSSEDSITVRINIVGVENCYPLSSGKWFFCAASDGEDSMRASVTPDIASQFAAPRPPIPEQDPYAEDFIVKLPCRPCDCLVQERSGNHWYGYSCLDEDGYFYIDVNCFLFAKPTYYNSTATWPKRQLTKLRKAAFGLYFMRYNKLPKTGRRVLFTSSRSKVLDGNQKYVYERMVERGLDKKFDIDFAFKDGIVSHRSFKEKFRFTKVLATSDFIFTDDYQPELYSLEFDPAVKVVQLWHACGAFKAVGFERLGKPGSPGIATKSHKCYTHVTVSSDLSGDHNAEAFAIPRSRFYSTGIARTDQFFDEKRMASIKDAVLKTIPQCKDASKVILYAPTFRGNGSRTAFFPTELLEIAKTGQYLKEHNMVMLLKMHPFVPEKVNIPAEYRENIIDSTSYPEINDLLTVTDLLITDYSSVIYEAALMRIPMLFFAFDLEEYETERGFYEPFKDTVPGKIVSTMGDVISSIDKDDYEQDKLEPFLKKNFQFIDGHSTDRIIDLIFGNEDGG